MKNLPDGVILEVGTTAVGGISSTCPRCGANPVKHEKIDKESVAAFWMCGSWEPKEPKEFYQSEFCECRAETLVARQEIAALKARAEKAEAERDEARGVVKRAVELIGEMQLWGGSDELALAGAWFDVLPEWAREAKDAARK